jgi:leucyl/phenylalanyl-tRNA---protein transferase
MRVPWIQSDDTPLPPAEQALGADSEAPGLVAVGGRLTPWRLREAYGKGLFPWFSEGQPVLWWSPDPRMVLRPEAFKVSRSLRKTLRHFIADPNCQIRVDADLPGVVRACARSPRRGQDGTWIVPEMVMAYDDWHRLGGVHSVEAWVGGERVAGLYGVSLGRMFFGESMYTTRADGSKIALAALVCLCREHGIAMIDCQQVTAHLASLGARPLPRSDFLAHLEQAVALPAPRDWSYHGRYWAHLLQDDPAVHEGTP